MELSDECIGMGFKPVVAKNKYIECYFKMTNDQQGQGVGEIKN